MADPRVFRTGNDITPSAEFVSSMDMSTMGNRKKGITIQGALVKMSPLSSNRTTTAAGATLTHTPQKMCRESPIQSKKTGPGQFSIASQPSEVSRSTTRTAAESANKPHRPKNHRRGQQHRTGEPLTYSPRRLP